MDNEGHQSQTNVEELVRLQLEVYARELREHLEAERELRCKLEETNRLLENRIRELSALNNLIQQHLQTRSDTERVTPIGL